MALIKCPECGKDIVDKRNVKSSIKIIFFVITLFIALLVLSSCASNNSNDSVTTKNAMSKRFSIRNGITFGITKDQVIQVEEKNGLTLEENEEGELTGTTNIAGFDNCRVFYSFSEGELCSVAYHWTRSTIQDEEVRQIKTFYQEAQKIYDSLEKSLSEKYTSIGKLESSESISYVDFGTIKDIVPGLNPQSSEYLADAPSLYGFKQYLTEDGNNFVEISIDCDYTARYLLGEPFGASASTDIYYNSIPKETYEAKIEELNQLREKKDNDL